MAQGPGTRSVRREEIVRATIRCLARYGYTGVTLQKVARAASLNQALPYYYFRTKDALLQAAFRSILADLKQKLIEQPGAPRDPRVRLGTLIRTLLELDRETRIALLQFSSVMMQKSEFLRSMADLWHELRTLVGGIFKRGVDAHLFRRAKQEEVGVIILGIVEGVALQLTIDPGVASVQEAERLCVEATMCYLTRSSSPASSAQAGSSGRLSTPRERANQRILDPPPRKVRKRVGPAQPRRHRPH